MHFEGMKTLCCYRRVAVNLTPILTLKEFFSISLGAVAVHLMTLLGSHSALQDDNILGKLRKTFRNCLEMVLALRDYDRGSSRFKGQEDIIENHVIARRIAGQKAVKFLN